jgi:hypothetical protein
MLRSRRRGEERSAYLQVVLLAKGLALVLPVHVLERCRADGTSEAAHVVAVVLLSRHAS